MLKSLTSGSIAILAAVVLVLASFIGIIWAYVAQKDGRELVQHTMQVETRLYRLLSLLDDAETGQRGYLLTDDARFLAPYLAAIPAIDDELKTLVGLTSDNPIQQKALVTLRQQTAERLDLLKRGIDFRQGGDEPQALGLVRGGAGRELMGRMRQTLARMVAEENRLLEIRERAQDRNYFALLAGILLAFGVAVALGVIAIRNAHRQEQSLLASREAVENARQDNTGKDNTAKDNTVKGNTVKGNTAKDNTVKGDTVKGDTAKGDTAKGDTAKGDTAKDNTTKGDTAKDDTVKDNTVKDKAPEPAVS